MLKGKSITICRPQYITQISRIDRYIYTTSPFLTQFHVPKYNALLETIKDSEIKHACILLYS